MKHNILFLVLFAILSSNVAQAEKKLIYVQQLFRHGARYPIYPRTVDGSDYAAKEHSLGELSVQGKSMHYLLGKKVYAQYWNQLFRGTAYENQYNNSKFYIKSTDVNRTIESCQSHIMGIFENLPKITISADQIKHSKPLWPGAEAIEGDLYPNALQYHPLPIHVQKLGTEFNWRGDFLRAYSPENCPNQDYWSLQNQASAFANQVYNNQRFKKALSALSQAMKQDVSFQDAGYFYDNFECSFFMERAVHPVFTGEYARELAYIYTLDLYINLFFTDLQLRTTSSGFFEATLNNIHRAIKSKDVQWVIYSAHDTTVANMLAAMNLTNAACIYESFQKGDDYNSDKCIPDYPGYSASIIFEVYEDTDKTTNTFKIRYMGQYRKIPFCDYKMECPVSRLQSWYDESIKIQNFAANCGMYNDDKQFYKAAAVLEFGIILGFLIYWIMRHLKRARFPKKKRTDQAAPTSSQITTNDLQETLVEKQGAAQNQENEEEEIE